MRGNIYRVALSFFIVFFVIFFVCLPQAFSIPISFKFQSAPLDSNNMIDPQSQYDFLLGQIISGVYTFESTTPDMSPNDPYKGDYDGAVIGMNVTIGNYYTGTLASPGDIVVINQPSIYDSDYYVVYTPILWSGVDGSSLGHMTFLLEWFGFPDDSLPLTPITPHLRSIGSISPTVAPLWDMGVNVNVIPEPGTMLLLGSGIGGILAFRKKLKKI